jgi:hypothetical protein
MMTRTIGQAAALALLLTGACADEAPDSAEATTSTPNSQVATSAQGLTVLQLSRQETTRFVYKEGTRGVTIETRRGAPTPAEYLELDDAPPAFATEVHVLDRAASPIYVRAEASDEDDAPPPSDPTQHAEDVALAPQALRAAAAALPAGEFDGERTVLTNIAETLAEGLPAAAADKAIVSAELVTADVEAAAASRKHAVALYKARLKKLGVTIGWHSATRVAYYVNNTWTSIHDECNHGRCPKDDGMSEVCHWVSAPRKTTRRTAHCSTTENFSSVWTHNCNDDSHLQVITLRYDRPYSSDDGSCHDKGANPDPDGCDPSTWNVASSGSW